MEENTEKAVKLKESKKVLKAIKKLEFDDAILESMGKELQNTESKRLKQYKSTLRAVKFEAIFLSWVSLSFGKIFEFFRCLYNCEAEFKRLLCLHQNALLVTAILLIFTDFLTIYGLKRWKSICLFPGLLARCCALVYFCIIALFWILSLSKLFYVEIGKSWNKEDSYLDNPWTILNIKEVQMIWFLFGWTHYIKVNLDIVFEQLEMMENYAKPNPKIS